MLSGTAWRSAPSLRRAAGTALRRRPSGRTLDAGGSSSLVPEPTAPVCGGYHTTAACVLPVDPDAPKVKQSKVKKKVKKVKGVSDRDAMMDVFVRALDEQPRTPPPATPEEMARRNEVAIAYTKGMYERHNDNNHDLSCKIRMKQHCIDMLPKGTRWREEALKITDDGPPYERHIPTDYPPIPGFDITQFMDEDDEE